VCAWAGGRLGGCVSGYVRVYVCVLRFYVMFVSIRNPDGALEGKLNTLDWNSWFGHETCKHSCVIRNTIIYVAFFNTSVSKKISRKSKKLVSWGVM